MTQTTDQTTREAVEAQVELARLREHNEALLAELKKVRADVKRQASELEALTAERDQALADVQDTRLGQPVRQMLERISVAPDVLQIMLDRHGYRFAHEDGRIVLRDREGNVPKIVEGSREKPQEREVLFTETDLRRLLCEEWQPPAERSDAAAAFATVIRAHEASGGGARPSGGASPGPAAAPTPAHKPVTFGIR